MSNERILLRKDGTFIKVTYNNETKEITRYGEIVDEKDYILLTSEQLVEMNADLLNNNDIESFMMYTVANAFHIQVEDMRKKTRQQQICMARDTCFYIMRRNGLRTYISIGYKFRKDHATVMHGISVIERILDNDNDVYHEVVKRLVNQFVIK